MTETNENREETIGNKSEKRTIAYKLTAIIGAMLLIISAGVFMYEPQLMASEPEKQASPPAMPPMPVETAEVRIADSAELISAVGTLRSDESVVISAEIAGRVTKIGFSEGVQIDQNKVLIKLDSNVLQAELDQTLANRDLSLSTYERTENLLKDNAVSKQERDEAYAKYKLDEARVRLAQAQLAKTTIKAPFSGTLGLRQVSLVITFNRDRLSSTSKQSSN